MNFGPKAGRPFNHYTCEKCGTVTVSKDEDDGVTPFLVKCRATGCRGVAKSGFCRGPQDADQTPHIIWYKPSPAQLDTYVKDLDPYRARDVRDHVDKGGLLQRGHPS